MPNPPRFNILVVYFAVTYPLRATIHEHLYSFGRYLPHRVFYLNLAVRRIPKHLAGAQFDLVIFHNTFLSRWDRPAFRELMAQVEPLREWGATLAAVPQDEFLNTDLLVEFINRLGVDCVFPVSPESEWPAIYAGVDFAKVRFEKVLTGYLDPAAVRTLDAQSRTAQRTIDIGYRAFPCPPWLGRLGQLKVDIAKVVEREAPRYGIKADVSTRPQDVLLGSAWYEFLLRSKYALGVEGGASVLDRDGTVRRCTENLLAQRPATTFDEAEQACFPGLDGQLRLVALSPRHLEACATRTCQILVSGEYNGILTASRHYIELHRDFSNLDEVLTAVARDDCRQEMTETAHREIALSPECGYPHFAEQVVNGALGDRPPRSANSDDDDDLHERACRDDRAAWRKVRLISLLARRIPAGLRGSSRIMALLRRMLYATR